jgi:HEAT repeat protein
MVAIVSKSTSNNQAPAYPVFVGVDEAMYRNATGTAVAIALFGACGCARTEQGPILAGGREVKSWLADLHDRKPQVRRQSVLKLGNVGDSDPAAAEGIAEALRDTDALVRRDAILAAAKLTRPGETILAQLRAMSQSDRDTLVRDHATKAMTHFGAAE